MLKARLSLEALRNGVPNREAVKILGCNQPEAETLFEQMLSKVEDTENPPSTAQGMLVSGDFGTGKSHLLTHLENMALSRGFVCSTVAISKETPLYDLAKVFKSAIENGRMPGRSGRLIEELGLRLNPRSQEYDNFFIWADDTKLNQLHPIFPASLLVHKSSRDEDRNREIENFWAGDRIYVRTVKTGLREIGQYKNYPFRAPKVGDLPPQRLRFMTALIKAAGYKGWVILLDEIELIGQYSLLQRGRSYAELSRWMGRTMGEAYPGLVVVGTVTADFASVVISPSGSKMDRDKVGARLEQGVRYRNLAQVAEEGMQLLERSCIALNTPTEKDIGVTMDRLRRMYSSAYNWDAPALPTRERGAGYQNRMRYRIRAAVNEWDLRRLYPDYSPETEMQEYHSTYEENLDLERESKDDAADSTLMLPSP